MMKNELNDNVVKELSDMMTKCSCQLRFFKLITGNH